MRARRDPDRLIHTFLLEGQTELAEQVYDAVRDQIETTRQGVVIGPWRTNRINGYAKLFAAATALMVAIVGYQLLPGVSGPGATPSLLARGTFVTADGAVELEATGEGSSVTGRLTVSEVGASFTVDLQCTRTTEDGLVMIGGITTATTGWGSVLAPVGSRAAIVFQRGSPVQATIWSQRGGHVIAFAPSCLASLDEQLSWERSTHPDGDFLGPIDGTVELGP